MNVGKMIEVSSSSFRNITVFGGRVLLPLWYLSTRIRISLSVGMVCPFRVCTGPLKTFYGLTKK